MTSCCRSNRHITTCLLEPFSPYTFRISWNFLFARFVIWINFLPHNKDITLFFLLNMHSETHENRAFQRFGNRMIQYFHPLYRYFPGSFGSAALTTGIPWKSPAGFKGTDPKYMFYFSLLQSLISQVAWIVPHRRLCFKIHCRRRAGDITRQEKLTAYLMNSLVTASGISPHGWHGYAPLFPLWSKSRFSRVSPL